MMNYVNGLKRLAAIGLLAGCGLLTQSGAASAQDVRLVSDAARDALDQASSLRSLEDDADPQDYIAAARADYRRLLTALYARGYYGGRISITIDGREAAALSPLAAPASIDEIVINVTAGPRFRFGQVDIGPLAPQTVLPEEMRTGETARSETVETAVGLAIRSWRDIGYAKASVAGQSLVARHDDARLDVDVDINPRQQLRFGQLQVIGNETVSDARIRQIAGLPTGEVFSPDEIAAAERRLRRTGTFSGVSIVEGNMVPQTDLLPMRLNISEAKPRRFGFGIELSSLEGLTLSGFWLHRNFLGGAERFRTEAEVAGIAGETGGIDYRLGASFNRPAVFGPDTDFFMGIEIAREDEPDFLLDSISIETGFSRIITEDLTVRAGVGLLRAREETDAFTREYTLLTLPLDATLDRRNDPANATAGYFIDLDATPFISIDGDIAGSRLFSDVRGYRSFGNDDRVTLAGRLQVGSVLGADTTEAPADFLFYSGGGGTVRGQPYQSLGTETTIGTDTVTTGGISFAGAQLEARVGFNDSLSFVGFYDVGHVGTTGVPGEDGEWHAGAGIGLRYNTGIGPIRLDLATPASGDNAGEELQVYIGIGQAF